MKENDYTKESYKKFKSVLKDVEKILNSKKATQKQIDEALVKLNNAIGALKTNISVTETAKPENKPAASETKPNSKPAESAKADNSELKSVVDAAKKLKEKDYTKESFEVFKSALKDVEKVLNDKNATHAQIYEAMVKLNDAVEALETKDTAPAESKPKQEDENADKLDEDEKSEQIKRPAPSAADDLLAKIKNVIAWLLELLFGWLN